MRDMANSSINIYILSNEHDFLGFKIQKQVIKSSIVIRGTSNLTCPPKSFSWRKERVKWEALKRSSSDMISLKECVQANEELKSFAVNEIEGLEWTCFSFTGDLINRRPDTFWGTFFFFSACLKISFLRFPNEIFLRYFFVFYIHHESHVLEGNRDALL